MKIEKNVVLSQSDIDNVIIYLSWYNAFSVCRRLLKSGRDDVHVVRVLNTHGFRIGYALEDFYGII